MSRREGGRRWYRKLWGVIRLKAKGKSSARSGDAYWRFVQVCCTAGEDDCSVGQRRIDSHRRKVGDDHESSGGWTALVPEALGCYSTSPRAHAAIGSALKAKGKSSARSGDAYWRFVQVCCTAGEDDCSVGFPHPGYHGHACRKSRCCAADKAANHDGVSLCVISKYRHWLAARKHSSSVSVVK
jgi:hypothetical protein